MTRKNKHPIMKDYSSLLSIDDLSNEDIHFLLNLSGVIQKNTQRFLTLCAGKILSLLFFEPSTRTYFSFSSAMQRLGGNVIGFSQTESTSVAKGETLEDTARMMAAYSDMMVVRHAEVGSIKSIANIVDIPIINGGEGSVEHPTQTLCDLYTIRKYFKRINGVTIGLYGDLKFGRTNHSLIKSASRLGANFICISPEALQMPKNYLKEANENGAKTVISNHIRHHLQEIDVLYVSRLQKERLPNTLDYNELKKEMVITPKLASELNKTSIIMHPLPRVGEIETAVDNDGRAKYFEQAANGVPVRMAILLMSFPEIRRQILNDAVLMDEINRFSLKMDDYQKK